VGLAALLSGASHYCGFDITRHANKDRNLRILEELVELFKKRATRPSKGWPRLADGKDMSSFPAHILPDEKLGELLSESRVSQLRSTLANIDQSQYLSPVSYLAPCTDLRSVPANTADLVISQTVLQHVTDIQATYQAMFSWLRPGGVMSHQINLSSHGLSDTWNGYRAYPELLWRMIAGRRQFIINRMPLSGHLRLIQSAGFEVLCALSRHRSEGITRADLSARWKNLSDSDLSCSGAFIQARK